MLSLNLPQPGLISYKLILFPVQDTASLNLELVNLPCLHQGGQTKQELILLFHGLILVAHAF